MPRLILFCEFVANSDAIVKEAALYEKLVLLGSSPVTSRGRHLVMVTTPQTAEGLGLAIVEDGILDSASDKLIVVDVDTGKACTFGVMDELFPEEFADAGTVD